MNTRLQFKTILMSCSAALAIVAASQAAYAADLPSTAAAPAPPPLPSFALFDGVEFHVQAEAGIMGNTLNPSNSVNIGELNADAANSPQLNQVLFTVLKAVDPKATGYAFGYTFQGMYGTDARGDHVLGLGDSFIKSRNQLTLYNGFIAAHLPWLFDGGVDAKIGIWSSIEGLETTDPSTTPFYTHSYIWNYALDVLHTGIITTTHVNSTLDIYLGVDTGNSTSFGNEGDNNRRPAGLAGIGLNGLLDGKLTILASTHIGPENALFNTGAAANTLMRYYNLIDVTYKINDDWTSVTEINYTHDDFNGGANIGSSAYGATEYLSYTFNKYVTFNGRAEVFRDVDGFYLFNPTAPLDSVNLAKGYPNSNIFQPPTTYGSLTFGVTFKPDVPKPLALLQIRPEIRYDRALSNNTPYGATVNSGGYSKDQFLFGGDVTIGF